MLPHKSHWQSTVFQCLTVSCSFLVSLRACACGEEWSLKDYGSHGLSLKKQYQGYPKEQLADCFHAEVHQVWEVQVRA